MTTRTALVTGASRGIGAATAVQLARRGVDLVINYRDKQARAEAVAEQVRGLGRRALTARADLTDADAVGSMIESTVSAYGRLDLLILNASGGLERDVAEDYARRLNRDAQVRLAELAADRMTDGGRIVFVTSHEAHFYSDGSTLPVYAPVAASKQAGERALLDREAAFAARGVSLVVVSGDLIDGTITAKLLDRARPGLIEERRDRAGYLPSIEDFADAVAGAALATDPDKIIFVGTVDQGTPAG
ncbi:SDR family oxidoreductase [Microlunatus soli]|uniref:Short chain dehydrogenase n=1 Tax=Microlunatus soli TaxID=630515 RepID=A0A1H1T3I3_9ACTN|nr:SDR family oxidoreductase [Microlunatus soli]SDS54566.1 short chain dehydrogenase [Microlunatus soli]